MFSPHVLLECDQIPTVLANHRHVPIGTGSPQHLLHLFTENHFNHSVIEMQKFSRIKVKLPDSLAHPLAEVDAPDGRDGDAQKDNDDALDARLQGSDFLVVGGE